MTASSGTSISRPSRANFAATRWSLVLAAANCAAAESRSRRALQELIQLYWFPLYAFARRQGHPPASAEDLVQEFFTRMIEKDCLLDVDRTKGKFRSFLLAAFKHLIANQRRRARALKRGGGRAVIDLDALSAEARYGLEPVDALTPERLFDRQWALAVLDHVLRRLRDEYAQAHKLALYDALESCLTAGAALGYRGLAADLHMTESALKVAAHRLRRRYRDLIRGEIAQTVDSPAQVEEEIAYLLNCL